MMSRVPNRGYFPPNLIYGTRMGGGKADVDQDHSKGPVGGLCEPLPLLARQARTAHCGHLRRSRMLHCSPWKRTLVAGAASWEAQ